MNNFTDKQREVIRALAEFYWTETLAPALAGVPEEHRSKMCDAYVAQIVTGLVFDDYWDMHNLTTPAF